MQKYSITEALKDLKYTKNTLKEDTNNKVYTCKCPKCKSSNTSLIHVENTSDPVNDDGYVGQVFADKEFYTCNNCKSDFVKTTIIRKTESVELNMGSNAKEATIEIYMKNRSLDYWIPTFYYAYEEDFEAYNDIMETDMGETGSKESYDNLRKAYNKFNLEVSYNDYDEVTISGSTNNIYKFLNWAIKDELVNPFYDDPEGKDGTWKLIQE